MPVQPATADYSKVRDKAAWLCTLHRGIIEFERHFGVGSSRHHYDRYRF
jgi:hypothetical protein